MIKKGSKVKVLIGKDKKKEGEIIEIDRSNNRAKVKGLNLVKKHMKTTKEKKGGIITKENFINISNLVTIDIKKEDKKVKTAKSWHQDLKMFTKKIIPNLKNKFGYKNSRMGPKIEKIVINMGLGLDVAIVKLLRLWKWSITYIWTKTTNNKI